MQRRDFLKLATFTGGFALLPRLRAESSLHRAPVWWEPPSWPEIKGSRQNAPYAIPKGGDRIAQKHFTHWSADGIWPESGRAGVIFAHDEDPDISWQLEHCRFSDCRGEVICGRYGMELRDLWFDHCSNLGVVGFGATSRLLK